MALPSVTYALQVGGATDPTEVNTNFNDLINAMTDGTKDFTINSLTVNGALTLANVLSVDYNLASGATAATNTLYGNVIPKAWAYVASAGTLNGGVNLICSLVSNQFLYTFLTPLTEAYYPIQITGDTETTGSTSYYLKNISSQTSTGFTVKWYLSSTTTPTAMAHSVVVYGKQ